MQTHELPEVGSRRCSRFIFILFDPVNNFSGFTLSAMFYHPGEFR